MTMIKFSLILMILDLIHELIEKLKIFLLKMLGIIIGHSILIIILDKLDKQPRIIVLIYVL